MSLRVAVIGAGSWGTTVAALVAQSKAALGYLGEIEATTAARVA